MSSSQFFFECELFSRTDDVFLYFAIFIVFRAFAVRGEREGEWGGRKSQEQKKKRSFWAKFPKFPWNLMKLDGFRPKMSGGGQDFFMEGVGVNLGGVRDPGMVGESRALVFHTWESSWQKLSPKAAGTCFQCGPKLELTIKLWPYMPKNWSYALMNGGEVVKLTFLFWETENGEFDCFLSYSIAPALKRETSPSFLSLVLAPIVRAKASEIVRLR